MVPLLARLYSCTGASGGPSSTVCRALAGSAGPCCGRWGTCAPPRGGWPWYEEAGPRPVETEGGLTQAGHAIRLIEWLLTAASRCWSGAACEPVGDHMGGAPGGVARQPQLQVRTTEAGQRLCWVGLIMVVSSVWCVVAHRATCFCILGLVARSQAGRAELKKAG